MGTRTEDAARRVPLFFALLTAAMTASALLYGLLMDEVELYRNILIPFSYVSLGMLIKYGDQAFDDGIFSKKVSLFLAIPGGLWMGSLILIDLDSATIFTGLLFALLIAAKYDNLAFKLGFVVAVGLALFAFVFQTSSLNLLGASSIFLVAFLDEKVNDLQWVEEGGTPLAKVLRQRPFLKAAIFCLCALGVLSSFLYFFAFLAFDFGYSYVEAVSVRRAAPA